MTNPKRGFEISIRARISILLLITILPLAILSAFLYYDHFKEQRKAVIQAEMERARSVGDSMQTFLNNLSRQSLAIGLALSSHEFEEEGARRILQESLAEYPGLRSFTWISPEGLVLASTRPQALNTVRNDRDYFIEILSGKMAYITDLRPSRLNGEPVMSFARAIPGKEGELLGVVQSAISPSALYNILGIDRHGNAGMMILDRKGQIAVGRPGPGWIKDGEKLFMEHPAVREAALGKELVSEVDFGLNNKGFVLTLSPVGSTGWVAVSAISEEDIRAPFLPHIYRAAVIFLLFTLGVLSFAFGVSRTIAAPIQELRARIASIVDGRKNQPLIIDGPPEIRDLTEAFNQMAEEIHLRETERYENLSRMRSLLDISVEILSEITISGLLKKIADASRTVTGSKYAALGLIEDGAFITGTVSAVEGAPLCPLSSEFQLRKGGVYLEILKTGMAIRYTDAELRAHSLWKGLPDWHVPLRGILGAPLLDSEGCPIGLVMATDRKAGDFTQEDEAALTQIAALASLGLQHVQARDRAEKRAADAEEGRSILDALMENIPEAISIATAPDAYITMVSKYGRELMGRPNSVIGGIGIEKHVNWKIFYPDGETQVAGDDLPLSRAVQRGEVTTEAELILETATGERIAVLCNAAPIKDKDDNITGGIVAWRDIRAIKAAREQLQKAYDQLELRVNERTAELAEANIQLLQEVSERKKAEAERVLYTARLEQSNRELDSFAAVASHDLQEPLRKIQAFGDRLDQKYRGKLDETALDYIKRMQAAAGRMQSMVSSLLHFSRVSTDVRPMSDTDLRKILRKIVQDLEIRIEQKGARVEIGNLPVIEADPDQMRHLFLNLVGNSLKFSGNKPPFIQISANETVPPQGKDFGSPWYDIIVEDNGIGFQEEYLEKIFVLFQRLHGRSAYEGSGVGLAICKKVVEHHNGVISARSEPGKGTRFIISLPRRQPAQAWNADV